MDRYMENIGLDLDTLPLPLLSSRGVAEMLFMPLHFGCFVFTLPTRSRIHHVAAEQRGESLRRLWGREGRKVYPLELPFLLAGKGK